MRAVSKVEKRKGAVIKFPPAAATKKADDGGRWTESVTFTMVPNQYTDEIVPKIDGNCAKLGLVILRKTFGYQKASDRLATSQLMKLTGQSRSTVLRGLKKLEEVNVIRRSDTRSGQVKIVDVLLPRPGSKQAREGVPKSTHQGVSGLGDTIDHGVKDYLFKESSSSTSSGNRDTRSRARRSRQERSRPRDILRGDSAVTTGGSMRAGERRVQIPPKVSAPPQECFSKRPKSGVPFEGEVDRLQAGLWKMMQGVEHAPPVKEFCRQIIEATGNCPAHVIADYFEHFCQGRRAPTCAPREDKRLIGPRTYGWFLTLARSRADLIQEEALKPQKKKHG